jgi:hypothetical protein
MKERGPDTLRSMRPGKLDPKRVRPEAMIRADLRAQLHRMYTRWPSWVTDRPRFPHKGDDHG